MVCVSKSHCEQHRTYTRPSLRPIQILGAFYSCAKQQYPISSWCGVRVVFDAIAWGSSCVPLLLDAFFSACIVSIALSHLGILGILPLAGNMCSLNRHKSSQRKRIATVSGFIVKFSAFYVPPFVDEPSTARCNALNLSGYTSLILIMRWR